MRSPVQVLQCSKGHSNVLIKRLEVFKNFLLRHFGVDFLHFAQFNDLILQLSGDDIPADLVVLRTFLYHFQCQFEKVDDAPHHSTRLLQRTHVIEGSK